MKSKKWMVLLLVMIITGLLAACGDAKSGKATKETGKDLPKTVNIGYFEYIDDSYIVKQKGWLEDELKKQGIELNWVSFQAGRDSNNAMLSKTIDMQISIGDPPVSTAVSTGIPYEIFWTGQTVGEAEALVAHKDKGIQNISDLKGKRIATTVTATSHYSLLSALQLNGLKASDVQIVDLNPADILSAWKRGDIDAAYTWEPGLSELLKDGTKLTSSAELAKEGHPTATYGIVRKEFGEKYPQLVELYIEQLIRAQKLYAEKPEEAHKLWADALQITEEEAAKQAKGADWLTPEQQLSEDFLGKKGNIGKTAQSLKKIGDFLVDQQSLPKKLDVSAYEEVINPAYLEKAANKK